MYKAKNPAYLYRLDFSDCGPTWTPFIFVLFYLILLSNSLLSAVLQGFLN
ncbi:hypothetical protein JoomaDRAFT_1228 [Galbibacter orientalis DSM 19592]|uniref:Uncharacterized protein n=1 Tax=Galbibacter orientalis DSM 19592 TaxID=926559 RepID=I3C3Q3_9FLAO|nr:hypothetical protein JoomaDRAFT_1228 [Galbibacter orientalis DSM 19592]